MEAHASNLIYASTSNGPIMFAATEQSEALRMAKAYSKGDEPEAVEVVPWEFRPFTYTPPPCSSITFADSFEIIATLLWKALLNIHLLYKRYYICVISYSTDSYKEES